MSKSRIRRWIWIVTGLVAGAVFVKVALDSHDLVSALLFAVIAGLTPLFLGAMLIVTFPSSEKSPLRFLGQKTPMILHSDEPEQRRVIPRPRKKARQRR